MASPQGLGEEITHQFVGIVVATADFFQDNLAFLREVPSRKLRPRHQIREEIHGSRKIAIQDLRVETGLLPAREGVEMAPDLFEFTGNHRGGPASGSFEYHMLVEVRQAGLADRIVTRTESEPDAHRGRSLSAHVLREHHGSIGQDGPTNAFGQGSVQWWPPVAARFPGIANIAPEKLPCAMYSSDPRNGNLESPTPLSRNCLRRSRNLGAATAASGCNLAA